MCVIDSQMCIIDSQMCVIDQLLCVAVALGNAISEAHLRTCLYSSEQIEAMKQQAVSQEVVNTYKGMVSLSPCAL